MFAWIPVFLAGTILSAGEAVPPPLPKREIAPPAKPYAGKTLEIRVGELKGELYLPRSAPPQGSFVLTIHFHTVSWFAIGEHLVRGLESPLLILNFGQGSSVYQRPFLDPLALDRWLGACRKALLAEGMSPRVEISGLDITSFSAGYGAVRELVQQPNSLKLIRRVILADSLYGSLDSNSSFRVAADESILPWLPLAREAAEGKRTLLITVSEVPTETYANSTECARAIGAKLGLHPTPASPELPATRDPHFPLRSRIDKGALHIWFYGGEDAQAHLTHVRHLADLWKALDAAGNP